MKKIGPLLLLIGVGLIAFSAYNFFTFDPWSEEPKYFWLAFVGMPLFFIGFVLSVPQIGSFLLKHNRKIESELNEHLKGQMCAVGEGLKEGMNTKQEMSNNYCINCGTKYNSEAKYCFNCGSKIEKTRNFGNI